MIKLRRIDHVCLRVADLDAASARWAAEFGLIERGRVGERVLLSCEDEPYSLELVAGEPGHAHTGFELAAGCSLDDAATALTSANVPFEAGETGIVLADPDGRGLELVPNRGREPWVAHARRSTSVRPGAPRRLGHVNSLTDDLARALAFYRDVLGMRLTDRLGTSGAWLHVDTDHHVVGLVAQGAPHFHHLAFDTVDIGQMRDLLDRLARHGRWVAWGPVRHGVGGNIASYVRIPDEHCFVELYCDMEQLQADHHVRNWPDDRFSSNTWGPLPPRSYFRFDRPALEWERESREALGQPLPAAPA